MQKIITVAGGDLRQLMLAKFLKEDGYRVNVFGFGEESKNSKFDVIDDIKNINKSDALILPMPTTLDNIKVNAPFNEYDIKISDIAENIKNSALILGGRINKVVYDAFSENKCIDYYQREELMIKNAVPTAEGAIEIAMAETGITLCKSKCLVVGFGRIGKVLSKMLKSLGADTYVSARKHSDLAWIDVYGYNAIHNNSIIDDVNNFDIIFNTVPSMIFKEDILKRINPECVIIDLASKPGGIDFEKASDLGLKVIWALSLPGKVAPITSGKIIKDTIVNIFLEEGF